MESNDTHSFARAKTLSLKGATVNPRVLSPINEPTIKGQSKQPVDCIKFRVIGAGSLWSVRPGQGSGQSGQRVSYPTGTADLHCVALLAASLESCKKDNDDDDGDGHLHCH